MVIRGKTKIVGIFGDPIGHTLSPLMHNAAFESLQMDYCYIPFHVKPADLAAAVQAIRSLNLAGVNITVPHKEAVISLLDRTDKEASFIGAVNTVTNIDGTLTGYNTDGRGFMKSLEEAGVSLDGQNVLIVGAGGACRAISYYISEKAASLSIFDIDRIKCEHLVRDLSEIRNNTISLESMPSLNSYNFIINATPLGLRDSDPIPVDTDQISSAMVVYDLVYRKTPLLREAEQRRALVLDGSGMLLWQGVLAFELWTGTMPPVDIMRDALMSGISRQ
jgi:shikimate dehydrogenase